LRRYANTSLLSAGTRYGTSSTVRDIRLGVSSGIISCTNMTLTETQRLDVLAGLEYGDSSLWWVIAAASNIGWGLQIPPGISIKIPRLDDIRKFIS
jgi:hypothetical protein